MTTPSRAELAAALKLHFRILTFQARQEELEGLGSIHLAIGLVWTWIVGIGRWWDDPGARLIQRFGLGSVVYVFALALVLWVFALPMRPRNLTYFRLLTFVALTSPPALIYALPVEQWYGVYVASDVNVGFLGVVALWRLTLYCTFLSRSTGLSGERTAMAVLLPIMLIIVALTMLNLERATFELMGGIRLANAVDQSYAHLILLAILSTYASVIAVPVYIATAISAYLEAKRFAASRLKVSEMNGDPPSQECPDDRE